MYPTSGGSDTKLMNFANKKKKSAKREYYNTEAVR